MKNFQRILVACLICSLFIGCACLPVKVEASATATVVIGVGAASASVTPVIALGAVLLIATGYTVTNLDKLISDTQKWIDSVPGMFAYLLTETAEGIIDIGILQLPEKIRVAVEDKLKQNGFATTLVNSLYVPTDFTSLNSLTKEQLLGLNIVDVMQEGNLIQQYTKNLLVNIGGVLADTYSYLGTSLSHVTTSLTAVRNQIIDGFDSLSVTMQTFRQNFVDRIIDVQTVIGEFRGAVNQNFAKLQDSLGVKIGDVNIHLHAIRENITTRLASIDGVFDIKLSDFKTAVSTFRTQFVEKVGTLQNTLSTFRTQFVDKIADIREVVGEIRGNLIQSVTVGINNIASKVETVISSITVGINDMKVAIKELSETFTEAFTGAFTTTAPPSFDSNNPDNENIGVNGGLGWFGHSYDILGQYGVGLLAAGSILKQFSDMPFFSSLITVSLSIGLVSVFFGILMNAAQSDGSKSTRPGHNSGNRAKNGG